VSYSLCYQKKISQTENLEPPNLHQSSSMASSSASLETGSSYQKAPAYEIRGRTMTLEEWELNVQVEIPVDFLSLAHHGCDLRDVYQASGWILVFLLLLLKPLSQSERRGLLLMLVQKHLELYTRSPGRTLLMQQLLTSRAKEVEKLLKLPLKNSLK